MRVLYVSGYYKPAYVYGGPVVVVSAICEQLAKIGVEVTVFTTNANGKRPLEVPLGKILDVDGVNVSYYPAISIPIGGHFSPGLLRDFRRQVSNYDIVVLDGIWSFTTLRAAQLAAKANIPYILPLHGQLMPWALKQKNLKKRLFLNLFSRSIFDQAAAIQCASYLEANSLPQSWFHCPIFVVPYGIDTRRFILPRPSGFLHNELNIPDNHLIIVALGRIHKVKRPDIALASWSSLKRPDVHLIFIGPDEQGLQEMLTIQAENLKCADRLHFTGLLSAEKVVNALADTDLLIMPSTIESFGNAALEAMASQVPVLLSDQIPLGYWVIHENAGKVVSCNPSEFKKELDTLLNSPEQLREMGKRGQRLVHEEFDISMVAHRTLEQYQSIIANGRPLN